MEKGRLQAFIRHPAVWGISICGILFTAFQLAGLRSVPLAEWALFGGWLSVLAEVWMAWPAVVKQYKPALFLLAACGTGLAFVWVGSLLYVLTAEQELGDIMITPPPPPSFPSEIIGNTVLAGGAPQQTTALEMTKPDLQFRFFGRDALQFAYFNPSHYESAREPKHWFALVDLFNPFFYPPSSPNKGPQPLPIVAKADADDFVRPLDIQGRKEVLNTPAAKAHVKLGDKLLGLAFITCFNCQRTRMYYLFFEVGVGGWYSETEQKHPRIPAATTFTTAEIDSFLDSTVPKSARAQIPKDFPVVR